MAKKPWYQDGLRFECAGCGGCCSGAPGYVWVNRSEIEAIAALLGMTAAELETLYVRSIGIRKSLTELSNGDCIFLDPVTRRCRVYEVRPRQCRTWPFWHSNLLSPERWEETCLACAGCGKGRLASFEEIEERLGRVRV